MGSEMCIRDSGDYWVLDLTSRELRKLGGDAPASTLMFAKFSPDGQRVAYVRANNIYVEDLRERRIWPVTTDGSDRIVNGTFDWGLRRGTRAARRDPLEPRQRVDRLLADRHGRCARVQPHQHHRLALSWPHSH